MNDGGQAFPSTTGVGPFLDGMTMRQWYKGMALSRVTQEEEFACIDLGNKKGITGNLYMSQWCGQVADAMIKEDEEYKRRKSDEE